MIETNPLQQIVQPLVELFQRQYPTQDSDDYWIQIDDRFGVLKLLDAISIILPFDISKYENAMRAVFTLLHTAGSDGAWGYPYDNSDAIIGGPLRLRLIKQITWASDMWMWERIVVIDHLDDDFDDAPAARQVALLVAHLEDPANLLELSPEMREIF